MLNGLLDFEKQMPLQGNIVSTIVRQKEQIHFLAESVSQYRASDGPKRPYGQK